MSNETPKPAADPTAGQGREDPNTIEPTAQAFLLVDQVYAAHLAGMGIPNQRLEVLEFAPGSVMVVTGNFSAEQAHRLRERLAANLGAAGEKIPFIVSPTPISITRWSRVDVQRLLDSLAPAAAETPEAKAGE